jgi:tetratricopeptide (TPR) repeat protein
MDAEGLKSALARLADGDVDAAERQWRALLEAAPRDPALHQLAAAIALRRGRHDEAERWARSCLALRAGHAPAMTIAGQAALAAGDFARARDWFAAACQATPDRPEPAFLLCVAQLECGDPGAQAGLERLQARFPREARGWSGIGAALRKSDKLAAAAVAFARAFAASGDPVHAIDHGAALLAIGRTAEAAAAFRGALAGAGAGDNIAAILGLAQSLRQLGEWGEARALLERGARLDPGNAQIVFALGLVCDDANDNAGAIAAYRRCVALRPDLAEAQVNLGIALQRAGQWDEARESYRAAIRARPDAFGRIAQALPSTNKGELWLNLGRLRRSLGG